MSPNFGDVVRYSEFGKDYQALVVGSRIIEHHVGENDEPLLTLIIVKPVVLDQCANCGNRQVQHGKPSPGGLHVCKEFVPPDPIVATNPGDYVHVVGDVPHESHAFDDDKLKALIKAGINTGQAYPGGVMPGGRWSEIVVADFAGKLIASGPPPAGGEGAPTVQ